jgi:hypothetical protein
MAEGESAGFGRCERAGFLAMTTLSIATPFVPVRAR